VRPADFQRVLGTAPRSRSAHFSMHHVSGAPALPARPAKLALSGKLSTGTAPTFPPAVDDLPDRAVAGGWLGLVVPKRHAKRAVTRTLIKRQMRAVMQAHASQLHAGLWVVRLRAPFDRQAFISAASERLRCAVHDELTLLVQRAAARG
jgi:ribonuclease P protein component